MIDVLIGSGATSVLVISAVAVGVLVPQAFWFFGFVVCLLGMAPTGATGYMVDRASF